MAGQGKRLTFQFRQLALYVTSRWFVPRELKCGKGKIIVYTKTARHLDRTGAFTPYQITCMKDQWVCKDRTELRWGFLGYLESIENSDRYFDIIGRSNSMSLRMYIVV